MLHHHTAQPIDLMVLARVQMFIMEMDNTTINMEVETHILMQHHTEVHQTEPKFQDNQLYVMYQQGETHESKIHHITQDSKVPVFRKTFNQIRSGSHFEILIYSRTHVFIKSSFRKPCSRLNVRWEWKGKSSGHSFVVILYHNTILGECGMAFCSSLWVASW